MNAKGIRKLKNNNLKHLELYHEKDHVDKVILWNT